MKKHIFAAMAMTVPAVMLAQSAVDAYNLSRTDINGTARFMAMGGAFTALGGDLSTLNQNPAGIGVYRRSEIGVTLDISPRSVSAQSSTNKINTSSTPVFCSNFGYIGTANLGGAMQTFSWGASYNRVKSFNRKFRGFEGAAHTSLTNYIADFSNGIPAGDMDFDANFNGYNPYFDSNIDWLSILAYSSFMINPDGSSSYRGLWQNGTSGVSNPEIYENGYVDEYSIDFGGNVENVVMWGIGFGITDLQYNRTAYYSESMENALVPTANYSLIDGNAAFDMGTYSSFSGTGFNLKLGLIFKPVNEFRIGVAFHTPTWYSLTQNYSADTNYKYLDPSIPQDRNNPFHGSDYTEYARNDFKLTSPWKFMVGVAGVLGSNAIISADYELQAYNKMRMSFPVGFGSYESDEYINEDISTYYKNANIFRVGAEYRVTPSFSVRAGYNYTSTTASDYMLNGGEVLTSGTDTSFSMDQGSNAISVGLGYRYKAFYIDAAYVYRNGKSTFKPYTNYGTVETPSFKLTETQNSIVISAGFKF